VNQPSSNRRLPKVAKVILSNQYAFIKGRQLIDGVVAVNEVLDFAKKSIRERLSFKSGF
jgi:tellurite resistance protein